MNRLENIPIDIVQDTNGTAHTSLQIIAILEELQHDTLTLKIFHLN